MPVAVIDSTTPIVVAKMVEAVDWESLKTCRFLEPSAGTGNILGTVRQVWNSLGRPMADLSLSAIEIDPKRRGMLLAQGFDVVGSDFLQYPPGANFDLILMNPPTSECVAHVLKAWECLECNGQLVALIDSAELLNLEWLPDANRLMHFHEPVSLYATNQRMADLIEACGSKEDLGPCFKGSDRPTSTNVTMITLRAKYPL